MENLIFSEEIGKNKFLKFIFSFFVLLTIWWVAISIRDLRGDIENNIFTLIYPFFSLIGFIAGLHVSRKWGGFKSYLGGSILMFSFGLLAQFFGQAMYAYFIYIKGIDVPYPSVGDVGYFGSVIFYILGVILLAKVSGIKISFKSLNGKLQSILIPLVLLMISYIFFLKGHGFDFSDKLRIFLDFGYPLGQAVYVSIAILALLMCRNTLGGLMKNPITLVIVALIFQYFSDFTFLYQASIDTWFVGGINDFMYLMSYFLMTLSLVQLGSSFEKIKNG